jgi:tyrocidine synthetase III
MNDASPAGTRELSALRAALMCHPGVKEAEAACIPDLTARPVAVVVTSDFVSGPELRRHLRAKLGEENAPDLVAFLPELPRALDGSLDLADLRGQLASSSCGYRYIQPGSAVERRLAGLWQGLLGQPDIGIADDFVELGGDSLSAVTVLTEVHTDYGVEVSLTELFELATIQRLAAAIDARRQRPSCP